MDGAVAVFVEALEETWTSLRSVLAGLAPEEWRVPTGCPGWDVSDQVSHVIGCERWMLGDPLPDHELSSEGSHVRSELGRAMELAVDERRGRSPARLLEEYDEVFARRLAALRADETPSDAQRQSLLGRPLAYKVVLDLRVFDCFAHEQDVRRATARPGGFDGLAARLALAQVVRGWRAAVTRTAGLDTVRVVAVIGGDAHELSPRRGDDGGGAPRERLELRTGAANGLAVACGRADAALGEVAVTGDRRHFEALAPLLAFTP